MQDALDKSYEVIKLIKKSPHRDVVVQRIVNSYLRILVFGHLLRINYNY